MCLPNNIWVSLRAWSDLHASTGLRRSCMSQKHPDSAPLQSPKMDLPPSPPLLPSCLHACQPSRPTCPPFRSLAPPARAAVRELATRVQAASPLGQYAAPLAAVKLLISIEPVARALVGLPTFKPDPKAGTGRALQLPGSSWLGPCFSVSCYPDELIKAEPDVTQACFAGAASGARTQVGETGAFGLCACALGPFSSSPPPVCVKQCMPPCMLAHLDEGLVIDSFTHHEQ
jgi:hypothetical protein